MNKMFKVSLTGLIVMAAWHANADDLAAKATNPIGDLVQVQLQYQYSPDMHDLDPAATTTPRRARAPLSGPLNSV